MNVAFVILWFFDAEVLTNGTVVGVPAGETLEFSFAQGRNFDRRLKNICRAPLQQMPVMACENCFDPTAEMQRKRNHVSNTSTTIVNSGHAHDPKVEHKLHSGGFVAEMHGEGIEYEDLSGSDSNAAAPLENSSVRRPNREICDMSNGMRSLLLAAIATSSDEGNLCRSMFCENSSFMG